MKLILFLSILGAFTLDAIVPASGGGLVGLNITNVTIAVVVLALIASRTFAKQVSGKKIVGVHLAIIISVAVFFSLFYAQFQGVYEGVFLDNVRSAKSFVFVPALLYGLAFMLIDTREQGERYLLLLVLVLGMLNLASAIGAHFGMELFQQADTYPVHGEDEDRLVGFTGNPNKTAYLTVVLIAFQYYLYRFHKSRLVRSILAVIMAGGVVVVLLSGSRGGMLVLIVVIVGLAYRLRNMRVVYGAALLIPVLIGMLLFTESSLLDHTIERLGTLGSTDTTELTSSRNIIWSALLSDYSNSFVGMLFGNGYGASKFMGIHAQPHNVYLRVLVEFGIFGLGIFIYFIFSMFRRVVKARLDKDDALKASVLASGYVVVFAWGFTTLVGVLDFIWFTIGTAMATLFISSKKARGKQ